MAAVLQKDRKASAEFVAIYSGDVYSYVRHRLLPRTDLAEDLTQEVFLAAWEGLHSFRGDSSLRNWLLAIARNRIEDHYRRRLREPFPSDVESPDPADDSPELRLDEEIDRQRLSVRTRQVLGTLPEIYSFVLLWRYWEKRSVQEIAAETGRTEKAVERLLARARAVFRARWTDA